MPGQKPKIVIVTHSLAIGGGERMMLDLAAGLSKRGAEMHIVIFQKIIEYPLPDAVAIHHFQRPADAYPRRLLDETRAKTVAFGMDEFIRKKCGRPDLVLSNFLMTDQLLGHSRWNVHFVIHNTTSRERREKTIKTLRTIYPKKPAVCVSKGVMEDFAKTFTKLKFPPKYIYNGIDAERIEKLSQEKSTINIENYMIHVGTFKKVKRYDILIQAYHLAKIQTPLVLVGYGYERQKNYGAKTRQLVKDLNLENQVIFAGKQSNPYPLIKSAKFLVLSSDVEGLPTVLLEACALETPAVSTDCPSGANEILPSENLCPIGNVEALAKLMQKADKNPEKYRVPLAQKFTLDFATEQYLKLLK